MPAGIYAPSVAVGDFTQDVAVLLGPNLLAVVREVSVAVIAGDGDSRALGDISEADCENPGAGRFVSAASGLDGFAFLIFTVGEDDNRFVGVGLREE